MAAGVPSGSRPRWSGRLLAGALWLALAVLLVVAAWRVLPACGVRLVDGRPLLVACPVAVAVLPSPAAAAASDEGRHLRAEIARLERALAALPNCTPLPAMEPTAEPPTAEEAADIPEEAWEAEDLGFLEGCWTLITDYRVQDIDTRESFDVRSWEACFAVDGSGGQELIFTNGRVCRGELSASYLADGRLRLADSGDVQCDDGWRIFERHTDCTRTDAQHATCITRTLRTGAQSSVTFRR